MLMRFCLFVIIVIFTASVSNANVFYDDGQPHTFQDSINGSLYVDYEVPQSTGTTVDIIDPAVVGDTLFTFGTSRVNLSGGSIQGGQYISGIVADDFSCIAIVGGTVGDTIVGLADSFFDISGGNITADMVIAAGEVGCYDTSTFKFHGTDFKIDSIPVDYGIYNAQYKSSGILSGKLADGTTFESSFTIYDGGSIVLVPEPTSLSMFLVGMQIFAWRRKKSKQST